VFWLFDTEDENEKVALFYRWFSLYVGYDGIVSGKPDVGKASAVGTDDNIIKKEKNSASKNGTFFFLYMPVPITLALRDYVP
jgi:hypothetical protein